jgi:hypothetical protein
MGTVVVLLPVVCEEFKLKFLPRRKFGILSEIRMCTGTDRCQLSLMLGPAVRT